MAGKNSQRKGIMFILDGLGDRPVAELKGKTPLEAAHTPNLDRFLAKGMGGLVDPLLPGVPVDTHIGTAVLMGVSPRDASRISRGPVEAVGIKMPLSPGDIAIRCNFATLQQKKGRIRILDRRAGRLPEEVSQELCLVLQDIDVGGGIIGSLWPATQHRAVLRLSGPDLSSAITDSDPMGSGLRTLLTSVAHDQENTKAVRTAEALNLFIQIAHQRLSEHPLNRKRKKSGRLAANGIITRGAGRMDKVQNLLQYLGLRTMVIAGESTIFGLARLLGHATRKHSSFTALPDTDVDKKITACVRALHDHDMVYVHVKAPDICAHDMDPLGKKRFLERFDKALARLKAAEAVIAFTADHSTDSNTGSHCGDPVPSILYSPAGRRDQCRKFGEYQCCQGGLGRIPAAAFLASMLDNMGCLHYYKPEDEKYYWQCH